MICRIVDAAPRKGPLHQESGTLLVPHHDLSPTSPSYQDRKKLVRIGIACKVSLCPARLVELRVDERISSLPAATSMLFPFSGQLDIDVVRVLDRKVAPPLLRCPSGHLELGSPQCSWGSLSAGSSLRSMTS